LPQTSQPPSKSVKLVIEPQSATTHSVHVLPQAKHWDNRCLPSFACVTHAAASNACSTKSSPVHTSTRPQDLLMNTDRFTPPSQCRIGTIPMGRSQPGNSCCTNRRPPRQRSRGNCPRVLATALELELGAASGLEELVPESETVPLDDLRNCGNCSRCTSLESCHCCGSNHC